MHANCARSSKNGGDCLCSHLMRTRLCVCVALGWSKKEILFEASNASIRALLGLILIKFFSLMSKSNADYKNTTLFVCSCPSVHTSNASCSERHNKHIFLLLEAASIYFYERRVATILLQIYTYYHYEHKERLHLWMKYTLQNVPVVLPLIIVHARTFLSGHSASKIALFAT